MFMCEDEDLFIIELNPYASSSTLFLWLDLSNISEFDFSDDFLIASAQLHQVFAGYHRVSPIIEVLVDSH